MKRFAIGAVVKVVTLTSERVGVVVRHGRDGYGVYTEVRYKSGETERVHRSMLRAYTDKDADRTPTIDMAPRAW